MIGSGNLLFRGKTRVALRRHVQALLAFSTCLLCDRFAQAEEAVPLPAIAEISAAPTNSTPTNTLAATDGTNVPPPNLLVDLNTNTLNGRLAMARYLNTTRQPEKAEPLLVGLLGDQAPESLQKAALLELAVSAQAENDLARAQDIYAQYRDKWPGDPRTPEILLHQGQIFRQMGLNDLALSKFYSVMTTALALKDDQLNYYQRIVLQAQLEIADTQYLAGKFTDAAEFYSRLLQKDDPSLNRAQIQFRYIRSLIACKHDAETVAQAEDFIARFPDATEEPEVRYDLAQGLKALGRNSDALQQVLLLLKEQRVKTTDHPELWAYWQQRVGNEIANEFYKEGDYVRALEIYVDLAQLSPAIDWQVPVAYQTGVTYERLLQPQKALEAYNHILTLETIATTNESPDLKTIFEMARWRADFLKWQLQAETANNNVVATTAAYLSTNTPPPPPQ